MANTGPTLVFSKQPHAHTYLYIMHQPLLLVDFVGLDSTLFSQSEDTILSRPDVGPAQVNILSLLILGRRGERERVHNPNPIDQLCLNL